MGIKWKSWEEKIMKIYGNFLFSDTWHTYAYIFSPDENEIEISFLALSWFTFNAQPAKGNLLFVLCSKQKPLDRTRCSQCRKSNLIYYDKLERAKKNFHGFNHRFVTRDLNAARLFVLNYPSFWCEITLGIEIMNNILSKLAWKCRHSHMLSYLHLLSIV